MKLLIFIATAALFLAFVLINKVHKSLPLNELRRRAREKRTGADSEIFKVAAYGESFEILLWLLGSLAAALLILQAASFGWWLAVVIIFAGGFFVFASKASADIPPWQERLAGWIDYPLGFLLTFLQPVLHRPGNILKNARPTHSHSKLYEKDDLLDLLKHQNRQADNRFSELELAIVRGALSFGDKKVADIMTPRSKLKMLASTDAIGPLLMDELHKTNQRRFAVVKEITKSATPQVIGSLYINDLLKNLDEKGSIRDIMRPFPAYINEDQSLRQSLDAFLKTHQHLLIVVNSFEEVSGAISIEDVLEQILGEKIADEFENYEDPAAVAKSAESHKNHNADNVARGQK